MHEQRALLMTAKQWCLVGKGKACAHVAAKCVNCRGPHFTHANVCPGEREAR